MQLKLLPFFIFFFLGMVWIGHAQQNTHPKFSKNESTVTINNVTYPVSLLDTGTLRFLHDKVNNEADILNNRGVKAFYAKDYSLALRLFKQAQEVRPNFKEAIFNTASVHIAQKNYDNAQKVYDQLLLVESKPEVWLAKGNVALLKDQQEEAIKFFQKAIALDGKMARTHFEMGNAYLRLKKWKAAISAYTKAIELDDSQADYFYARGKANLALTEFREAVNDFDKAINANPKHDMAYAIRGKAKFELHEYKNAIKDFDNALKINAENLTALINRAATKHQLKDYGGALEDCNAALKIDPKNGLAFLNRGIVKLLLGDSSGSCNDWKKALNYGAVAAKELLKKNCNL